MTSILSTLLSTIKGRAVIPYVAITGTPNNQSLKGRRVVSVFDVSSTNEYPSQISQKLGQMPYVYASFTNSALPADTVPPSKLLVVYTVGWL